mgnify:CR=1 FL=1
MSKLKGSRASKLEDLCFIEGEPVEDMMERSLMDGTCPAICMNEGCDFVAEYEPDSREGWCDACETNTVVSAVELAI